MPHSVLLRYIESFSIESLCMSQSDSSPSSLVEQILDALPQTQCQRCGYPDCEQYARAAASGEAEINQCPPGGQEGVARLAAITGRRELPLNPAFGQPQERTVAYIDEDWCIGCTLCIKACPVDAIIGSNKLMHTVVEQDCTGCELCIPACPVDCIEIEIVTPNKVGWQAWSPDLADKARARYAAHQQRDAARKQAKADAKIRLLEEKAQNLAAHSRITDAQVLDRKKAVIADILAKARAKREQSGS